ncbi:MAG: GIY-YIG nuclease family protein [Calditrichia bacterium]
MLINYAITTQESSMRNSSLAANWFLYLIRCKDGSHYTGITTNVERRFQEHCDGGKKSARYLRGKAPLELVFYQQVGDKSTALRLEYRVRKLSVRHKKALIAGEMQLDVLD